MPERLFNIPVVQQADLGKLSTQEYQSRLSLAMAHMKSQMPTETAAVSKVAPFSWWDRFLISPTVQMTTSPGRAIKYNPKMLPSDQTEIDDILAHELVHVRQAKDAGGYLSAMYKFATQPESYTSRPMEAEAFKVEDSRRAYRRDIPLPPSRKK